MNGWPVRGSCLLDIERLRVHHILCTALFQGKGYSESFCGGMAEIVNTLRKNPDTYFISVCAPDSVCLYCPHLTDEKTCAQNDNRIVEKDRRLAELLGLDLSRPHTIRQLWLLVREKLTKEGFNETCGDCSWYAAGLCSYESLVKKLQ